MWQVSNTVDINRRATKSFLVCDVCSRSFHDTCFSVECDIIRKLERSEYLVCCESCNYGCKKVLASVGQLDSRLTKCEELVDKMGGEMERLYDKQRKHENRLSDLENNTGNLEGQVRESETVDNALREMEERDRRRFNLKITQILESEAVNAKDRLEHDSNKVIELIKEMQIPVQRSNILACYRTGKKTGKKSPRPLIVRFSNKELRGSILKAFADKMKTKNRTSLFINKINISPDLTKMQQNNLTSAYEEAKAKNEREVDSNVKWIVSGPRDRPKVRQIETSGTIRPVN